MLEINNFYSYFPALITYILCVIFFCSKESENLKKEINEIVYAKVNQKYININKKKPQKPPKKIKPKPKFVEPIFVQMMQKRMKENEARKNINPEIKKKKINFNFPNNEK